MGLESVYKGWNNTTRRRTSVSTAPPPDRGSASDFSPLHSPKFCLTPSTVSLTFEASPSLPPRLSVPPAESFDSASMGLRFLSLIPLWFFFSSFLTGFNFTPPPTWTWLSSPSFHLFIPSVYLSRSTCSDSKNICWYLVLFNRRDTAQNGPWQSILEDFSLPQRVKIGKFVKRLMEEQSAFKHKPWIFQLYTAVAQKKKAKQQILMLTTIIAPQPKAAKQDVNCVEGLRMWTPPRPPSRPTVAPMHNNRSRMTREENIYILQYGIFFFFSSPVFIT